MALNLGTAAGDTLESISGYIAQNATALSENAQVFIASLAETDVDFSTVGDPDQLNYLQWDYDAELSRLLALRPGFLTDLGADAESKADAITALEVPAAPTLAQPTANIPTLDAQRPTVTLPTLPGTDVGDAPTDAPSLVDLAAPDAPLVVLPSVPTFEDLQLPATPSFTIPTFADDAPVNRLAPPTAQFGFVDAGYASDLRDPLVAKLLYDLENGGYGIDANDELALWGRARDRAEAQGRQAVEAALKRSNSMSFPLPTGALVASMEAARSEILRQLSEANRDIALKRADLYVENRRFTIEQVQELEKISIALYNAIQERAMNVAKVTVELGLATFEATVRNYQAQLEGYKAGAQVFETRVRAELTKAEVYKAQIDAERLRGEVNVQRVALYQAQLNGVQTVVNLYKNRIEALRVLAEVQSQKIEIFKSRVQAYATRVQAKAAEFDMYKAAVGGEIAKLDIYKTDISAFETVVRAEESRIRALTASNDALVAQYKARVAQYTAQLEGVTKRAEIQDAINKTNVAGQAVNAQVYRALTDAVLAGTQTRIDAQKMNNAWSIAAVNSRVEVVKMRLEELKATIGLRTDIDKFGAKFYGDPLTATLASLNGLSVKSA